MSDSILVLPSWYPSKLDMFDGDFVQRHTQAIALYKKQYIIYVVKDKNGIITNDYVIEKKEVANVTEIIIYYKSIKTGISFLDKLLSQKKYIQLYKKTIQEFINYNGVPKLVHLHIFYKAGIVANWVKKKWKIPFIATEHWTGYYKYAFPNIYTKNIIRYIITKKALKQTALLVPVTNDLGNIINLNLLKKKFVAIPNVVDTSIFTYKQYNQSVFTFCHISTMGYQKNVEGIIEAAAKLKSKGIKFVLNLIGNEPLELIELAKQKKLLNSTVFFKPSIAYNNIASELQQANALLMFSRFENLPCVILESLCCGTPVISSKVGGIAEVLDESNGILINENIDELVKAMETMITDYDKYNRPTISKNAQQKYCFQQIGKQYATVYNQIITNQLD